MSSDRHESDRLWQWIDEQKRPAQPRAQGRARASDLYSHDARQNWVQAVSASLRAGRSHANGSRFARKRLEHAIRLSLKAGYPPPLSRTPPTPRRHYALLAIACLVLFAAALVTSLFLSGFLAK